MHGRGPIEAGPRLLSVDTEQGTLLNALLGGAMGGGALNLSAVDYNALANGSIVLGTLLDHLRADLGIASPSQALDTAVTLNQLLIAAADAARVGGDTLSAVVLDALAARVSGLEGTIRLGTCCRRTSTTAP